jgi:hypothetical protein
MRLKLMKDPKSSIADLDLQTIISKLIAQNTAEEMWQEIND